MSHCGFWLAILQMKSVILFQILSKNEMELILFFTMLLMLVAACLVSAVTRQRSILYCPIKRHFKILPKSIGIVISKQTKQSISNLDFVSMKYQRLFLIWSTQLWILALPDAPGNFMLQNSASPQKKQSIIGEQKRKLATPTLPIPKYKMFCPWLFISAFCKYALLNWGVFNILNKPQTDASSPTMMVQERLKGAMTRKAALSAVSAMQIGVIWLALGCALSSILLQQYANGFAFY